MRTFVVSLALLSVFGWGRSSSTDDDWSEVYDRVRPSVAYVTIKFPDQPQEGHCSAVVVQQRLGRNEAITAGHCVSAEGSTLSVGDRQVEVLRLEELADLAVITFPLGGKERTIPIAFGPPPIGKPVAVIGHAFGIAVPAFTAGHAMLSAPRHPFYTDAVVIRGDSGAAIVDRSGVLVGMIQGYHSDDLYGHAGYGAPADIIRILLDSLDISSSSLQK